MLPGTHIFMASCRASDLHAHLCRPPIFVFPGTIRVLMRKAGFLSLFLAFFTAPDLAVSSAIHSSTLDWIDCNQQFPEVPGVSLAASLTASLRASPQLPFVTVSCPCLQLIEGICSQQKHTAWLLKSHPWQVSRQLSNSRLQRLYYASCCCWLWGQHSTESKAKILKRGLTCQEVRLSDGSLMTVGQAWSAMLEAVLQYQDHIALHSSTQTPLEIAGISSCDPLLLEHRWL